MLITRLASYWNPHIAILALPHVKAHRELVQAHSSPSLKAVLQRLCVFL
jgi:hypothetical protein